MLIFLDWPDQLNSAFILVDSSSECTQAAQVKRSSRPVIFPR